jgi:hypothetical protein
MDKKEVIAASVMLRLISFAPSPGWKSHLKRRATTTTDSLQPTRNLSKKWGDVSSAPTEMQADRVMKQADDAGAKESSS